jgi:hypothetical protein
MSSYNRADAVAYALEFWDEICHDGRIATKLGYLTNVNNVKLTPGKPFSEIGAVNLEEDCTHFLSCCVGDHVTRLDMQFPGLASRLPVTVRGGGLNIGSPFAAAGVFGQTWTPQLVVELLKQGAKVVGNQFRPANRGSMPQPAWNALNADITSLDPGDVIAYASKDDLQKYEHICLIVGRGGKIACHTRARYGKDWDDVSFPWVTLLKMP